MKTDFEIREMLPAEYALLDDFLYEAIFQRDDKNLLPRTVTQEPALRIYIENFGQKEHDHCVCAVSEGKVVGAAWTRIIRGYGSVDDTVPEFAVSLYPEYRGKGMGTAMMEKLFELLRASGCEKASLAVQKDNYALNMYRKLGFQIVDENEEEYIMVINLEEMNYGNVFSGGYTALQGCVSQI